MVDSALRVGDIKRLRKEISHDFLSLSEVLDRLSILKLKASRIKDLNDKKEFILYSKKLGFYVKHNGYKQKPEIINMFIKKLYEVNGKIWDLEADIRKGKEGELGLEEVGRRAIEIRNLNKERISIKNDIMKRTGNGIKDVKMNHASE